MRRRKPWQRRLAPSVVPSFLRVAIWKTNCCASVGPLRAAARPWLACSSLTVLLGGPQLRGTSSSERGSPKVGRVLANGDRQQHYGHGSHQQGGIQRWEPAAGSGRRGTSSVGLPSRRRCADAVCGLARLAKRGLECPSRLVLRFGPSEGSSRAHRAFDLATPPLP